MNEQIEQLEADKATLEAARIVLRKHGNDSSLIVEDAVVRIKEQINRLEKQAADPWQDAKEHLIEMESFLSATYWQNVVAKYVRHLEKKVEELESQPECKPLWAVVPKDDPDDCWRQIRGFLGQVAYHLFTSREDAEKQLTEAHKVVPIWGE